MPPQPANEILLQFLITCTSSQCFLVAGLRYVLMTALPLSNGPGWFLALHEEKFPETFMSAMSISLAANRHAAFA